jgi:hypothetical protein
MCRGISAKMIQMRISSSDSLFARYPINFLVNTEDEAHVWFRYGRYSASTLSRYADERCPDGATTCFAAFSHSIVPNLRLPQGYCWHSIERWICSSLEVLSQPESRSDSRELLPWAVAIEWCVVLCRADFSTNRPHQIVFAAQVKPGTKHCDMSRNNERLKWWSWKCSRFNSHQSWLAFKWNRWKWFTAWEALRTKDFNMSWNNEWLKWWSWKCRRFNSC